MNTFTKPFSQLVEEVRAARENIPDIIMNDASNDLVVLLKDMYKAFHPRAYKPGTTHVYSNLTNRFGKYSNVKGCKEVMSLGQQAWVRQFLVRRFALFFATPLEEVLQTYQTVIGSTLGKDIGTEHIESLHSLGYVPLRVKAIKEGLMVPYGVPTMTIQNTVSGFGWLVNMLETCLSAEIWNVQTAATTAYAYKKNFLRATVQTGMDKEMVTFMGHDFSYRGCNTTPGAAASGFGHLTSFAGSDIIPAGLFAQRYYDASFGSELVMASVDATEHSVMCSYGNEGEIESIEHLMTDVSPEGILSIVSDTWDFWKVVSEYLPSLKDKIMERDGTLVIRPDSGDPVDILCGKNAGYQKVDPKYYEDEESWKASVAESLDEIFRNDLDSEDPHFSQTETFTGPYGTFKVTYEPELNRHDKTYYYVDNWKATVKYCDFECVEETVEDKGLIQCLWEIFGGTETEKGYKLLDSHIGAIYGDSITLERQEKILGRLIAKGFCPSNVLGIGSFTYQMVTRDTHGSAVKATAIRLNDGEWQGIFKQPKTDSSKNSAKGLMIVERNSNGDMIVRQGVTEEEERRGLLAVIFEDSVLYNQTNLNEIREEVDEQIDLELLDEGIL